eukprot:CAMPEP_0170650862 /NCGR_PEP_ID=MMETSP0224-20130122/46041_1 /TAXON_ID=285029 /ORGANISM="Togula jolla, Strain CCCM 725" /LENGTH=881 /DNA_ID=CAMNT_0010982577 /DNA_START=115 /DNA_END=2760 /DNA_ORIENTATION=+
MASGAGAVRGDLFDALDTNHDGSISREEFQQAINRSMQAVPTSGYIPQTLASTSYAGAPGTASYATYAAPPTGCQSAGNLGSSGAYVTQVGGAGASGFAGASGSGQCQFTSAGFAMPQSQAGQCGSGANPFGSMAGTGAYPGSGTWQSAGQPMPSVPTLGQSAGQPMPSVPTLGQSWSQPMPSMPSLGASGYTTQIGASPASPSSGGAYQQQFSGSSTPPGANPFGSVGAGASMQMGASGAQVGGAYPSSGTYGAPSGGSGAYAGQPGGTGPGGGSAAYGNAPAYGTAPAYGGSPGYNVQGYGNGANQGYGGGPAQGYGGSNQGYGGGNQGYGGGNVQGYGNAPSYGRSGGQYGGHGMGQLGRGYGGQSIQMDPDYYEQIVEIPKVNVEILEKLVEVPEPQVVDRIIEIPQIQEVVKELPGPTEVRLTTREVPKIEVKQVERIVEVPEVEYEDRFVEVPIVHEIVRVIPRIQVHEIPIERIIQVPKKVIQEIEQPIYRPVPHVVKQPVERVIPVPRPSMQQMEVVNQVPEGGGMNGMTRPHYDPAQAAYQAAMDSAVAEAYEAGKRDGTQNVVAVQQVPVEVRVPMPYEVPKVVENIQPVIVGYAPAVQTQSVMVEQQVTQPRVDLFDALDRNHDGYITRDEFQKAVTEARPVSGGWGTPPTPPAGTRPMMVGTSQSAQGISVAPPSGNYSGYGTTVVQAQQSGTNPFMSVQNASGNFTTQQYGTQMSYAAPSSQQWVTQTAPQYGAPSSQQWMTQTGPGPQYDTQYGAPSSQWMTQTSQYATQTGPQSMMQSLPASFPAPAASASANPFASVAGNPYASGAQGGYSYPTYGTQAWNPAGSGSPTPPVPGTANSNQAGYDAFGSMDAFQRSMAQAQAPLVV